MKLLIGADLVPTKSNQNLFSNADATALVGGDLLAILQDADYRIFNLEMPLTDIHSPIFAVSQKGQYGAPCHGSRRDRDPDSVL